MPIKHKGTRRFPTLADAPKIAQQKKNGVSNSFLLQDMEQGMALENGHSGALDPDFEKKAGQFEMNFGRAAMKNGQVNGAVDSMMDRIAEMVAAEHQARTEQDEVNLASELGKVCGTKPGSFGVAGAVPKDKVMAHMLGGAGNLRTKMTAVVNFGRPFQGRLKALNEDKTEDFIKNLKANDIAKAEKSGEDAPDTDFMEARTAEIQEGGRLTKGPAAGESAVSIQKTTRGQEGEDNELWRGHNTAKNVGLTKDEAVFQGMTTNAQQDDSTWADNKVLWEEGARKWLINENNEWVSEVRKLSLPLKAGPSGTTDRLMETNQFLGVASASDARGACLAYLLPINAHSMVEIMEGASRFGLDYTPGPSMYQELDPFGSLEAHAPDETWWAAVEGGDEEVEEVVDA